MTEERPEWLQRVGNGLLKADEYAVMAFILLLVSFVVTFLLLFMTPFMETSTIGHLREMNDGTISGYVSLALFVFWTGVFAYSAYWWITVLS